MTGHGARQVALAVAILLTLGVAVGMDAGTDEHPVHTATLALTALVVAALHLRFAGRFDRILPTVGAAVVAQPALHGITGPTATDHAAHPDGAVHLVLSDGPTTGTQVLITALVVVASFSCARLFGLLARALHRPLRLLLAPATSPERARKPVIRSHRRGSMLRWCGWVIRAARRGPPAAAALRIA